ncbi:MAG TPA: hypothetical protein VIL97_00435 [Thermoanaerobaculia bacterium]
MTIYFSGSISGGRDDVAKYRRIADYLESAGHRLVSRHVCDESLTAGGEALTAEEIFDRDMAWIAEAASENGALVAEVSVPSLGVGYEIATARYRYGMPVICLYRREHTQRCSAMVSGDRGVTFLDYTEEGFESMLEKLGEALRRRR